MTTRQILAELTEELGNLANVPQGWIKILTSQGAGDKSEIVKIANDLRSTRELGTLVKGRASKEYAGFYIVKKDGTPVCIIDYDPESNPGKPWRVITPTGDMVTRSDYRDRSIPRWRRPTRTYTDPVTGKQSRFATHSRETVELKRSNVSLNEISGIIPFQDGVDLYGLKKDVARAQLNTTRQLNRAGIDSDVDELVKDATSKFLANKAGGSLEKLKERIKAVSDKVREKLDAAISSAETGGEFDTNLLNRSEIDELRSMLYDLSSLNRHMKKSSERGIRNITAPGMKYDYDYRYFNDELKKIEAALARVDSGNSYREPDRY
jgi:hypothetical protein